MDWCPINRTVYSIFENGYTIGIGLGFGDWVLGRGKLCGKAGKGGNLLGSGIVG